MTAYFEAVGGGRNEPDVHGYLHEEQFFEGETGQVVHRLLSLSKAHVYEWHHSLGADCDRPGTGAGLSHRVPPRVLRSPAITAYPKHGAEARRRLVEIRQAQRFDSADVLYKGHQGLDLEKRPTRTDRPGGSLHAGRIARARRVIVWPPILHALVRPEAAMFYEPKDGSGLPHNPLNAIVVPRPIGWISTLSAEGVPNLAPYSFFNAVAYTPPQVMFAATSNHQFGGPEGRGGRRSGHRGVRRERRHVGDAGADERFSRSGPARGRRVRVRRPYQVGEQAGEMSPRGGEPGPPGVPLHQVAGGALRRRRRIRTPSSSAKSWEST